MRRTLILFGLTLAVVAFIVFAVHFFTTGKVSIQTNNSNNVITITQVKDGGGDESNKHPFTKQASESLKLSLRTGEYVVSVQGNSVASSQTIQITAHHTTSLLINPPTASGVEPVADINAQSIAASASRLLYVNATNGGLFQIDNQNDVTRIAPNQHFIGAQWITADFGVAQDSSGHLFQMTNGSLTALGAPTPSTSQASNFAVSSNGQVYISFGSQVYAGSPVVNFKKIYSSTTSHPALVATGDKVAILDGGGEGEDKSGTTNVVIANASGVIAKKTIEAYTASWSKSGTYLAVSSDINGMIYDRALNKVATIPNANISNIVWLDDNTLFYSLNDQLWTYNLRTQNSVLVANMPLGEAITELKLSDDKSYIYAVVSDENGNNLIKRVGLRNQTVPEIVYQLQSILPETGDQYSLDLINFTHPTVLVEPGVDVAPIDFRQTAATELQQKGFDLSKLQIIVSTIGQD